MKIKIILSSFDQLAVELIITLENMDIMPMNVASQNKARQKGKFMPRKITTLIVHISNRFFKRCKTHLHIDFT